MEEIFILYAALFSFGLYKLVVAVQLAQKLRLF